MLGASLEDLLYDAFAAVMPSNMNIIYAQQAMPEPTGTYMAIKPIHLNPTGMTRIGTLASGAYGHETIRTQDTYEWFVQINCVGPEASSYILTALTALGAPMSNEEFEKRGFSVLRKTQARNVALKREDKWVNAYNVEIYFLLQIDTDSSTPVIDYVKFENNSLLNNPQTIWVPNAPPPP